MSSEFDFFSNEQKQQIQKYFESGEYGIIARTAGFVRDKNGNVLDEDGGKASETKNLPARYHDWRMVSVPEWRWDKYEYRAYTVLNDFPDTSDVNISVDPLFVFGYGYTIYYNEEPDDNKNVKLYSYSFNSVSNTASFNSNVLIEGDFQALGANNIIGSSSSTNSTLTIYGQTYAQGQKIGPKLRFTNSDESEHVDLIYTDKGETPSITFSSNNSDAKLIVPNETVINETVTNETVDTLNATTAIINNLTVTNLNLINVADVIYPVGSYYWSTDPTSPNKLFGGDWVQISNTFLYAATYSEPNATTATHGESEHVLTVNEIPTHTHGVTDPGHIHGVTDPGHSHSINDPGHEHDIVTRGDDYNGSFCSNQHDTANFVGDGWNTLTYQNRQHGAYAGRNTTGITINGSKSNVKINYSKTNVTVNNAGGGKPHNNMPPYIASYCWHRVG